MKLSLALPSLFPQSFYRTHSNILASTHGIDFEILAVTPFEAQGPNVCWIREESPKGSVQAQVLAYEHMTGDILVTLVDDIALVGDWAKTALANLERREGTGRLFCLGLHQTNFVVGTVFGIYFPFFPFVRKGVLEATGGYLDPTFGAHYADPDFALRIWSAGGRCERTDLPLIERVLRANGEEADPPAKSGTTLARDMATFLERWRPIYGEGWSTETERDFNLDVDVLFEAVVGDEFSIFLNDPVFKRLYQNYGRNAARMKLRGAGISPPPSDP